MERRNAISTDNLTIIPDVKPHSVPLVGLKASAPPFKDETVSEPDRNDRMSVNSFLRRDSIELRKDRAKVEKSRSDTDFYGRPVRSAIVPPTFDDRQHSTPIEEYLFRFERAAKANLWRDTDKVDQIYHYLRGNAEKCYEDVLKKTPDIKWIDLRSLLEERFSKRNGRVAAFNRMLDREQGADETFRNYFYDKMALIRLVDSEMKIDDKILYLTRGARNDIKREIRHFLNDKKVESDDELYSIVFEIDDTDFTESSARVVKRADSPIFRDKRFENRMDKVEKVISDLTDFVYKNRNIPTKPKVHFERTDDSRPICTYCSKPGHSEQSCWKKQKQESLKNSKN